MLTVQQLIRVLLVALRIILEFVVKVHYYFFLLFLTNRDLVIIFDRCILFLFQRDLKTFIQKFLCFSFIFAFLLLFNVHFWNQLNLFYFNKSFLDRFLYWIRLNSLILLNSSDQKRYRFNERTLLLLHHILLWFLLTLQIPLVWQRLHSLIGQLLILLTFLTFKNV